MVGAETEVINPMLEAEAMHPELLKAAAEGKYNVLQQFSSSFNWEKQVTPLKNTALHIAMRHRHIDFVRELYNRCPSLASRRNSKGDTPLHVAIRSGYLGDRLADAGRRTSPRDLENGRRERRMSFIEYLLRSSVDPRVWSSNEQGESLLYLLSTHKGSESERIVRHALSSTTHSLDFRGPNGLTALHAAVIAGHSGIIAELVKQKPELVNKQDNTKKTPLHFAALLGDLKSVELFLQKEASIAYQLDNEGHSPLHKAAIKGKKKIIKKLLQRCPDCIDLVDNRGQNVLHVAVVEKQLRVVQHLSKHHPWGLINQVDKDGNTPLHLAAINCHVRITWALSMAPAVDLTLINNKNLTALNIAELDMEKGKTIFQKLMISYIIKLFSKLRNQQQVITTDYAKIRESTISRESSKQQVKTLVVVATLITSNAFAAALTLPGGYENDGPEKGTETLIRRNTFKLFVIFDAFAICSSISAAFLLVWVIITDMRKSVGTVLTAGILIWYSLVFLGLAFATHFYAILSTIHWMAIFISFIIAFIPITLPLYAPSVDRFMSFILASASSKFGRMGRRT
ncbi:PREDICTED: protein ACCELERATED CELL DEATH 6-like [Nelumbo nucifera]|nr:PREDICTED: protein ACCELERATED CELL DEATH 6-like [Nelumbo nucifera]